MKIINLVPNESTYLIEDGNRHYCLQRMKIDDDHPIKLVLEELDEAELDRAIRKCKSAE